MSLLSTIQHGKDSKPRRTMLYGTAGIGKSTWAASAPAPVFIQTEDGLGQIDCAKFPLASTFVEVLEQMSALYAEAHNYKTLVVDSLDWLERLVWAAVCQEHKKQHIEDFGYAKGYVYALRHWRMFLDGLDALHGKGMGVVLLAHSQIVKFEAPGGDAYDRYMPRLHRLANALITEWCDEVLFANYEVFTTKTGEGFDKRTIATGDGRRIVHTCERPAHVAKNRLNLPETLPLDYQAYAQCIAQAASTTQGA